jgi:aspartate kinase
LKKAHVEAARAAVKGGPLREELEEEIERDCEGLRGFLHAAQVFHLSKASGRRSTNRDGTEERS